MAGVKDQWVNARFMASFRVPVLRTRQILTLCDSHGEVCSARFLLCIVFDGMHELE